MEQKSVSEAVLWVGGCTCVGRVRYSAVTRT